MSRLTERPLIPLATLLDEVLPQEWLDPAAGVLDRLLLDPAESSTTWESSALRTRHRIVVDGPVSFGLPILPGSSVHLGRAGSLPVFTLTVALAPEIAFEVAGVEASLLVGAELLRAVRRAEGGERWEAVNNEDGTPKGFELVATDLGFRGMLSQGFRLLEPRLELPGAAMISDTGFILDFGDDPAAAMPRLVLGDVPADLVDRLGGDWEGIYLPQVVLHYQRDGTSLPPVGVRDAIIGSGGFAGMLELGDAARADEELADEVLNGEAPLPSHLMGLNTDGGSLEGMRVIFQYLALTFAESVPVGGRITGHTYLPFAERWFRFEASVGGPDGDLLIQLGGAAGEALVSLENEWLEIEADTIEYLVRDGVHYAAVSGTVRPKKPDLDWPKFKVERLLIGSDGSIEIDGGWIDVPEAVTLDFHGFAIEISAVGLGNEETEEGRRQWIGYSGGISLLDGIPISASVEGLKVSWLPDQPETDPEVTLTGIGVELEIPDALRLEGKVSYERYEAEGLRGDLFRGRVAIDLYALKTEVAGELIVGHLEDTVGGEEFPVLYIILEADLPSPLPLGSSGTAVFSLAGLFGLHVAPDRRLAEGEPEPWYEWYRREEPAYNVRSMQKWGPEPGHLAFGAGIGLGTQFDDGFSLNLQALVAVLIPGPVVLVEGRADLLKARGEDDPERRGAFYALAVFDGNADTFQANVDIQYELASVIAITGGLEAFFDFNDLSRWYLHLGKKDPESKRLQAELLALLTASSYLMIDAKGLETGAKVGFDWRAELGPVELSLVARIAVDAGIFWKPAQLEGRLELFGEVALRVFGIGLALVLEMLLEGRAPTPYWVHGRARVAIAFPWPLPDVDVAVELEWKEEADPAPVPCLKGAALSHHRAPELGWEMAPEEAQAPVVPVDATALLSFARPLFGWSQRLEDGRLLPVEPDRVGDWEFAYQLRSLRLERKVDGSYDELVRVYPLTSDLTDVLQFATGDPLEVLAPTPDAQEPQLRLWSRSPLDGTPRRWREAVADTGPGCRTRVEAPRRCLDWRGIADGTSYPPEFSHRGVHFVVDVTGPAVEPRVLSELLHAPRLTIVFPEVAGTLELDLLTHPDILVEAFQEGERVWASGRVSGHGRLDLESERVDSVRIRHFGQPMQEQIRLKEICWRTRRALAVEESSTPAPRPATEDPQELLSTLVLEPHSEYRLTVETDVEGGPEGEVRSLAPERSMFYFRTGGGPGSDHDYLPIWGDEEATPSRTFRGTSLEDLTTYVRRTVPDDGAEGHYLGDDLVVEFDEGYIEALYRSDERLALRVTDRNGRALGTEPASWVDGLMPLAWDPLLTWVGTRARDGCPPDEASRPGAIRNLRQHPEGLAGRSRYTASLVLVTPHGQRETGFSFAFTTSRYPTVEAHLTSGANERGEQLVFVPPEPVAASPDPAWTAEPARLWVELSDRRADLRRVLDSRAPLVEIHDALADAERARRALQAWNASNYPEIVEALDLPWEPLPPRTELRLLHLEPLSADVLVLETSEPLAWERIGVRLRSAGTATDLHPIASEDGTRALIFLSPGLVSAGGGSELLFTYSGGHPDLPLLTRWDESIGAADSVEVSVGLTLLPE